MIITDKKVIRSQIEALKEGQVAKYKFPEYRGGDIMWVELNNTGKGKKYNMSVEKTEAGKPTGKKTLFMNSDKPGDLANYIRDMDAEEIK